MAPGDHMRRSLILLAVTVCGCATGVERETIKVMVGDVICAESVRTNKLGTGTVGVGVDTGPISGEVSFGAGMDWLLAPFTKSEPAEPEQRCEDILKFAKEQARIRTELLKRELEAAKKQKIADTVISNLRSSTSVRVTKTPEYESLDAMGESGVRWQLSTDF